ncbi:hypothetical protein LTR53_004562 [Teratosphaeriaceae sp. CCFEE 6253]|nr:hypothetical protein LTR53_004562 [Teratosphaeriaceae sp. CCFEE 6253]
MVKFFKSIDAEQREWALSQQVFFIASAPSVGKHINLSPKGLPSSTLTIFDGNRVGYQDATGSGAETIAHLYENGRATLMFCSFDESPRIMRWFCTGRVIEYDDIYFNTWLKMMKKDKIEGTRAIILLDVFKVQTSCGYAVPLVNSALDPSKLDDGPRAYLQDRDTLGHWMGKQVSAGTLQAYHQKQNARSLDGCPGMKAARRANGEVLILRDCWVWLLTTLRQPGAMLLGAVLLLVGMRVLRAAEEMGLVRVPSSIRWLA